MKILLTQQQQEREAKKQKRVIEFYKHDDIKRTYVQEAYKQLNNIKQGFITV